MRLRCEVPIPSGYRQGRVFVQLQQAEPDLVLLLPARGSHDATHQIVNACGMPLLTHLTEHDHVISAEILRTGFWEFAESAALLGMIRPGMTFADVGANLGYFEVLLAAALGPLGQVYAFEPEPRNTLLLTANTLLTRQLCPLAVQVEVFPLALSDRVGKARLHVFEHNLGMHSLVYGAKDAVESRIVETTTLDALRWSDESPPTLQRRIDVLKADIQGSELMMLRGAERTIQHDRPVLCLEFEPYLSGPEACINVVDWLRKHNYSQFRVFHSNASDPYQVLAESARLLSADEVLALVERKEIAAYGTLLAFPDATAEPTSLPSVEV